MSVHHILGFRPQLDRLVIRPYLLKGLDEIKSKQTVRGSTIDLTVRRSPERNFAVINGKEAIVQNGSLTIRYPKQQTLTIDFNIVDRT